MTDYQLYQGDCLEILPTLADGSVDAIICDLPYGTTACSWDSRIPLEPLWAQFKRVIKPRGAVVLFGAQPFTSMLVMSNLEWFRYEWIWEKQKPTNFLHAKNMPLRAHESILIFGKSITYNPQGTCSVKIKNGRKNKAARGVYKTVEGENYIQTTGNYPRTIIKVSTPSMPQHQTQKPVALLEYLIKTYTNAGETVLDCVFGSGTTGVAALHTGRKFIGIELDPGYYAIAEKRIQKASQMAAGEFVTKNGHATDTDNLPLFMEVE